MEIFGYICAAAIGLLMGLLGGGGSVLTIPVFVYLLGISPGLAGAYSLFIIGTASSVGAVKNLKEGNVDMKSALAFGIPSIISVFLTTKFLIPLIPKELFTINEYTLFRGKAMMLVFATLLIIAGVLMVTKKKLKDTDKPKENSSLFFMPVLGIIIGVLAGLVGVGGGFLIIPVLVLIAKMPMKKAVGTTLVVIALNSILGFSGHVFNKPIDWSFIVPFAVISIAGILLGIYLSKFVSGAKLKKGFAAFVFLMAGFIIFRELFY